MHEARIVSRVELEPILCSIPQAATMLGRGVTAIYRLIGDGEICAVKSNGRTLLFVNSLHEYANRLQKAHIKPRHCKPQRLR